jgi:2-aminomuconate deaminase
MLNIQCSIRRLKIACCLSYLILSATNIIMSEIIKTNKASQPLGAYPHARKVGNLLFLSGIGPRNPDDNSIPGLELDNEGNIIKYDIEAECRSVFANVKAVLEASGSSWDKIVDVTVFLTNMKADFPIYNKVYTEYFKSVQACRTTVEVKSLPTPIAIELKVIATI